MRRYILDKIHKKLLNERYSLIKRYKVKNIFNCITIIEEYRRGSRNIYISKYVYKHTSTYMIGIRRKVYKSNHKYDHYAICINTQYSDLLKAKDTLKFIMRNGSVIME